MKLMSGAIFMDDPREYPKKIAELNANHKNGAVTELYSSLRSTRSGIPTARPDFRLKDVSWEYLEEYVDECNKHDIIFNYTANSSFMGDLEKISKNYDQVVESFQRLEKMGVKRTTIAHPILLDIVCNHTNIPVELSTILAIQDPAAVVHYRASYKNVNKICLNIDRNRDINYLTTMVKVCADNDIELEVIATEFCKVNRSNCSQIHRPTCYQMHAQNMSEDVARKGKNDDGSKQQKEVRGYPWSGTNGCIFNRSTDTVPWLVSNTVWPNELERYMLRTGVTNFKITTRTAPPEYGLFLTEMYLRRKYDGPLAALWLQLPASLLSARSRFNTMQKNGEKLVPYLCGDLSLSRHIDAQVCGNRMYGMYKFWDIYYLFPNQNWSEVVHADKPNDELEDYESNWADVWHKALTK